jgi:hypothetical protein
MTEIARTHSGGDHQEVVLEFSRTYSWAIYIDGPSSQVDALNLGPQYAEVLLFRFKLPDRRRYLGGGQNSGGDLIQERLENMMIARSISVISTSARLSPRAAAIPAKPPPTIKMRFLQKTDLGTGGVSCGNALVKTVVMETPAI